MTLRFDEDKYKQGGLVSAIADSNAEKETNRAMFVNAIRTYAPAAVTDGVSDDDLLTDSVAIGLTRDAINSARDHDYATNLDEVLASVPEGVLGNLALHIQGNEIDDGEVHNRAYAAHRKYDEAIEWLRVLNKGGEEAQVRVQAYAEGKRDEVRAQMAANFEDEQYAHMSDDLKQAWIDRVSEMAEVKSSDPKRLTAMYDAQAAEAEAEFDGILGEDGYTREDYATANVRAELAKGDEAAENVKTRVDLMRYKGADTPGKMIKALNELNGR